MCKTSWFLHHILLLLNVISPSFQPPFTVDGQPLTTGGHKNLMFHHPESEGKSSQEPNGSHGSSLCPGGATASTCVISSRRLRSPEKILDLHDQLQETLKCSSQILCTTDCSASVKRLQTPENTERGREPRKYHSVSVQREKESLRFSARTKSVTLSAAPSLRNKSATSDNADAFQSADLFTGQRSKSRNSEFHSESPEIQHLTLKAANLPDSPPETTASDTAAPGNNYSDTPYTSYGAATEGGSFAATCTSEKSFKSERKSSVAVKESPMRGLHPGNTCT